VTTDRPLRAGGARQHHYIPRWFLENFTENGKIARIELGGGKPPVITTVKNVAVERDLYTIRLPEQGRTSRVEDELAVIDGAAANPIRQLLATGDLDISEEDRQAILNLIASLWVRGPRWRRQQEAFGDLAIKMEINRAPNASAVQEILTKRVGQEVPISEAVEIKRRVAAGEVEFAPIGDEITLRMLDETRRGAVDLRYYRWELIRNLPAPLVLPDTPVVVQPVMRTAPVEHQPRGWSAIQLPLSPSTLLCLLPPARAEFGPQHYFAPHLNQLRWEIANWCFQEIFCAPSSANEASLLVAGRPTPPLGVTRDNAHNIGVRVDGLDCSPLRPRHRRVSWALTKAEERQQVRGFEGDVRQ